MTLIGSELEAGPVDPYDPATKLYVDDTLASHDEAVEQGESGPSVSIRMGVRAMFVYWSGFEANVSGHGYFQVQVDDNSDFSSPLDDVATKSNWATFDGLTTGTTYYVRVRAIDAAGNTGAWASTTDDAPEQVDTPDVADGAINADKITALELNVGQYIRSTVFTSGSSGWKIDANGDAEFNDVVVRGTIETSEIAGDTVDVEGQFRWGEANQGFGWSSYWYVGADANNDWVVEGVGSPGIIKLLANLQTYEINALSHVTVNGDLEVQDGSASAPSITFESDTDTGMYRWNLNAIGFAANGNERVVIGASGFIAHGVYSNTTGAAANVAVDSSGRLERSTSSVRFKADIAEWAPDGQVLALTPSTFRGSRGDAHERTWAEELSLGLLAEDVAERFPWAALYDEHGRPDAVNWNAITAALVGEVARLRAELEDAHGRG